MSTNEEKLAARRQRERKIRIWLTTLSWTTPVVAFSGFFTMWHSMGQALKHHSVPAQSTTASNHGHSMSSTDSSSHVLYQIGSRGPQVSAIQRHLSRLGFFHHAITDYYGPITAQAVKAFQAQRGLPETGKVDERTLHAMRLSLRKQSVTQLQAHSHQGSDSSSPVGSSGSRTGQSDQGTGMSSPVETPPSPPVTTSSAS
ncbi:MAG: peptidoglycan-binding protein [Alicyclobacillus herbarius]|nr:peptidoglycan-binding protein [Alicyclobacillus herbarius]